MKILHIIPALALTLIMGACDDDDKYQQGDPTPSQSVSPYFPTNAPTYSSFTPDDDMIARIPVKRLKTEKEQKVTIVASGNEKGYFSVPQSVDFEAGQDEAELLIDCHNLPVKEECSLHLTFDKDQLDPYVDGLPSLDFKAIVSVWTLYGRDVEVMFDNKPAEASEIYMLEGSRQFKITNFVGSGLDLPFTLSSEVYYPWGDENKAYGIVPTKNAWDNPWVENYWYLYDQANEGWPVWCFDGVSEPAISYLQIYSLAESDGYFYSYFCPYYPSTQTPGKFFGYMCLNTYVQYEDGTTAYPWIEINFEPLFDPNL